VAALIEGKTGHAEVKQVLYQRPEAVRGTGILMREDSEGKTRARNGIGILEDALEDQAVGGEHRHLERT
jgi:hypothetical protein